MQDLLLLMAVAAVFVFGYFAVKRLDHFLENNYLAVSSQSAYAGRIIKIGVSNPLTADSMTDILESFAKGRQNVSFSLFSGSEEELLRELSMHKLDVVFLPENIAVLEKTHYNVEKVSLGHVPVIMKYGGLAVEPLTKELILQKVLWEDGDNAAVVGSFIRCLKNGQAGGR